MAPAPTSSGFTLYVVPLGVACSAGCRPAGDSTVHSGLIKGCTMCSTDPRLAGMRAMYGTILDPS